MTLNTGPYPDNAPRWRAHRQAVRSTLPLELAGVLGLAFTLLGLVGLMVSGARMAPVILVGPVDSNLLLGLVWLLVGLLGLATYTATPPAPRLYLRGAAIVCVLLTLGGLVVQPVLGLLPLGGAVPLHATAALLALFGGFFIPTSPAPHRVLKESVAPRET